METCLRQIDIAMECVKISERFVNNDPDRTGGFAMFRDISDSRAHYCKEQQLDAQTAALFDPLIELYDHVTAVFDRSDPVLQKYFTISEQTYTSMGQAILLADRFVKQVAAQGVANAERYRIPELLSCLDIEEKDGGALPEDTASLTAFLQQAELTDAWRWQILDAATDFDAHIAAVNGILERAKLRFDEKLALAQPLIDRTMDDVERRAAAAGGLRNLIKNIGLALDPVTLIVRPGLMMFSSISASGNALSEILGGMDDSIDIRYGVLFDVLTEYDKVRAGAEKQTLKQLHALDDKTRLSILFGLGGDGLYGQEIAKLTGLTPATVSYHMSELTSTGFVTIEKKGVKLIYRRNVQQLRAFFDQLERKLLD